MTYLLQPKPPRQSASKKALRAVLLIVCIAFLFSFIAPTALPRVVGSLVTPLWSFRLHVMSSISHLQIFSSRQSILEENARLKEENELLKIDLLFKESVSIENKELRSLLGRDEMKAGVAAAVILHPSQTYYDIFIVDAPRTVNSGAVVKGRIALGTVTENLGTSLKVVLYSSPGMSTEGRMAHDGSPIVLEGKGGGNMSAIVPKDFRVSIDDFIVLPGDGSFLLAQVKSIDETETDSFKLVRAEVPLNIFEIRWVEIIPYE